MPTQKLTPSKPFPKMDVATMDGGTATLGVPRDGAVWQLIVVYRGKHCPICTRYLGAINDLLPRLTALGIDVVGLSADPTARAIEHLEFLELGFTVGTGLSVAQMQTLGLYISEPRTPEEAPGPFAEPAMFVVLDTGILRLAEIASSPFLRPDLETIMRGLTLMRDPARTFNIRGAVE